MRIKIAAALALLVVSSSVLADQCYTESNGVRANTGFVDGAQFADDVASSYASESPAQKLASCVIMAAASTPTLLWEEGCGCKEAIKKLCSWSPKDGIKAKGGASTSQCATFLTFFK